MNNEWTLHDTSQIKKEKSEESVRTVDDRDETESSSASEDGSRVANA